MEDVTVGADGTGFGESDTAVPAPGSPPAGKPALLVSACLLGVDCNYRQGHSLRRSVADLAENFDLVPVCPEVAGGLPVPRPAAEISGDGRVLTADGRDVTDAYRVGARKAVELANERGVVGAVLKARSPSCGPHDVYDGTHSGTLVQGQGVTAAALGAVGYRVLDEDDVANGRLPDPDR